MSANYDIIIRVSEENLKLFGVAADQVSKVGDAVKKTDETLKGAGGGADAFARKMDSASTKARSGLNSVAQMADVAGLNIGGIVGPASAAADAIGDIVSAATSFGVIGIAVGAAVVAIGILSAEYKKQHDLLVQVISANDSYIVSLQGFAASSAAAAAKVNELVEAMAHLQEAQAGGGGGPFSAANVVYFQNEIVALKNEIHLLTTAEEDLAIKSEHAASAASIHTAAENARKAALQAATTATQNLASATDAYYNNLMRVQGATNTSFYNFVQQNHAMVGQGNALDANARKWDAYNKLIGQRFPISVGAAKSANDAWLQSLNETGGYDKAKAAAERLRATLQGMIENALQPTAADPNMGDSWDEARKRFEAFATGTDTGAYGAEFKAMFDSLGMSAEDAARKFKDFSLFADPANLKLVDWGPVVANVEQQLLSMAGKANVTAEAMKEVWKNLSPQARSALASQGIDNATDALDALVDPAGAAEKKVHDLNQEIGATPTLVTTVFAVDTLKAATDLETFQTDVLDPFIAKYRNITISINAETGATEPGPDTGGTTGAPPSPPPDGGGGAYAQGLDWYVPGGFNNDSYPFRARLTSGERVQITPAGHSAPPGGAPNIIVYVQTEDGNYRRSKKVRTMAALGQT